MNDNHSHDHSHDHDHHDGHHHHEHGHAGAPAPQPIKAFVAALTWVMKDSMGEELDVLDDPVEFLVGGDDLLPPIDAALQDKKAGDTLKLYIQPEEGFGDFNDKLIFLIPREAFPEDFAKGVEVGMTLDGSAIQDLREEYPPVQEMLKDAPLDALYTVTDIYPEHLVIDGNHPLAGISIDLALKVHAVREATIDEVGSGSAGVGFFKIG
jgi:FKBP-type peptidyl-prolyl cis-trans isomerase SlyD